MDLISQEILRSATPFSALPDADRQHLAAVAEVKTFRAGDLVLREGEPSHYFYTIVSGRVKVFKTTPSGKDIIWGIFGSGDPVGSVAAFKETPYPATAAALEETVCIQISRSDLYSLMDDHPSIARGLLLGLTQRLVELVNRVGELTGARVEPRLARLFLRLAHEMGHHDRAGIFIPMALSRQELSDMTGTTIETCIRVMSKWQKDDTVHTEKDGFVVLDRAVLTALANH